jgi:hypothetical protein
VRNTVRHALVALVVLGALFGLVLGALQLAWHFRIFFARASFPLDLEWMEGGMLLHASRLAEGKTIYVPPTLEFIPFLYTPLYPALLALLSKLFGIGYLLGRLVSLVAFAVALLLIVLAAAREGRNGPPLVRLAAAAAGIASAGVVAASFAFTGTFYDLVRSDSLLLVLQAVAVYAALSGGSWRSAVLAGAVIALAFFSKQTASLVGVALGVGLLFTHWRRGILYGVTAAAVLGAGFLLLNLTSDGWFWTYVFKLHQSHGFNRHLAFVETPLRIVRFATPAFLALAIATLGLLLSGRLRRSDAILWTTAIGGFVASCIGFGTQWAFENAFIPAVYFPALAAAVLGARLSTHALKLARPKAGSAACAALVGVALGAQALKVGRPDAQRWVPSANDRAVAVRFIEHLRGLPGDLFIPFHPYYNVLANKAPHVHRMGVMDVGGLLGRPASLDEAIVAQKFSYVILDWKSQPWEWPHLETRYHDIHHYQDGFDAVRSFSGAETSPRRLLMATRQPPPLPPEGHRLADFESGWAGWAVEGDAFGVDPGPAPPGFFGRHAANSQRFGPQPMGALRSPPFVIERPRLRFMLAGPADPGLRVVLLDGPESAHTAVATGEASSIEWDVSALMGRRVILLVEDRSAAGGLVLDEVVAY